MEQQFAFAAFNNQSLFKDHYLQDVLPQRWDTSGMGEVRERLLALWQQQQPLVSGYNEAQLEENFIKPALKIVGHVYEVQPQAGEHQPDYAFFLDESARQAQPPDGSRKYWSRAVAVGDAKAWQRRLDRRLTEGTGWDFQNPSFQIYYYLIETGCRWAILTNGRHWRLYCGDPKPDMQVFYEVDLPALLEAEQPDHFAYFWLFFRREAFAPDPHREGKSFLDEVREESDRAAEKLREDVKDRVYRALLEAARGFMEHPPNRLTDGDLREVHDNALVLLYRLLFVLYAEAAELLPVRSSAQYRERYSLDAIKREVARSAGSFASGRVTLWSRLQELFRSIDGGDPDLGVPAYNGGLFDPVKHPFLEQREIADGQAAKVIDLLARTSEAGFVDYRDLGIRHLGSIYEGLLEYKLARAEQPMVVVRAKGKDLWAPEDEAGKPRPDAERCPAGGLYLATDKGERKATGSYYTPQYIVEYIVENTLGPLVEECETAEDILQLNVLDPAMGSGHFLVEATDFLAGKLLARGASTGIVGKGLVGAARVDHAEPDESDLVRLKRMVVERCIYGVDLNPLAVELAKLSLWLDTVSQGEPLSFLDHHLRCGNSLIGARVDDLPAPPRVKVKRSKRAEKQEAAGQLVLFDYHEFTRHANQMVFAFTEIDHMLSDSREAVQSKGRILQELEEAHRRRYQEIADLWCSRYFGNDYDAATYNELVRHLQQGGDGLSEKAQAILDCSREMAKAQHFLHWELEFPEVFFDEFGRKRQDPGFDAVIGNPPHGADLAGAVSRIWSTRCRHSDSAALFATLGCFVLAGSRPLGFVMPKPLAYAQVWDGFRADLLGSDGGCLRQAIDLGREFSGTAHEQCAIVCVKGTPSDHVTLGILREHSFSAYEAPRSTCCHLGMLPMNARPNEFRVADRVALLVGSQPVLAATRGLPKRLLSTRGNEKAVSHEDIDRYLLQESARTVAAANLPAGKAARLRGRKIVACRLMPRTIYPQPRVLIEAVIDHSGTLTLETVANIWPTEDWLANETVCALLNSRLFNWWINRFVYSAPQTSMDLDEYYIRKLPVARFGPPSGPPQPTRGLVDASLAALDANDYAAPLALASQALAAHASLHGPAGKPELRDDPYWQAQIAAADPAFPGREDFVHDLLASLAQRMIDLNKQKRTEIDSFLRWLEWYAGCQIEDLTGKTKVREFYGHDAGVLLDVLHRNKRRLSKVNPESPKVFGEVRQAHEQAVATLTPLLDALQKTDDLIDEIVYRLYGLTEEEIAIVEGRE